MPSFASSLCAHRSPLSNSRLNRLKTGQKFYAEPHDPTADDQLPENFSATDLKALQEQIQILSQDKEKLTGVVDNLRKTEKGYKNVKAILGDTNPEKLQEYVNAEEKARLMQEQRDFEIAEVKKGVKAEFQQLLDEANAKAEKAIAVSIAQRKEQEVMRAYTQKGGLYEEFATFATLSAGNVDFNSKGQIEIRDDANNLVTFKPTDPKEDERQATLEDFMVMIGDGQIDKYQFRHANGLKRCLKEYNKSTGANLPGTTGTGGSNGWRDLEGDALWAAAFQ